MARAIDADYLMERLNKKIAGPANKRYTEGFTDGLMRVRSMVHSMPTLTPPNEWVSVEERLPAPTENPVLVYDCTGVNMAWYSYAMGWTHRTGLPGVEITHWMPLPAPPDRRPPEGEV